MSEIPIVVRSFSEIERKLLIENKCVVKGAVVIAKENYEDYFVFDGEGWVKVNKSNNPPSPEYLKGYSDGHSDGWTGVQPQYEEDA